MPWRVDDFWNFQPTCVNSGGSDNSDIPCVTIQDYNMRFTFCSLLLQLGKLLESAIEFVFYRCTMRVFVFNVCWWLESEGKLMEGEDGWVKRVVWNLGGCNSFPSFTTGTLCHLGMVTEGTVPGVVAIPAEGSLMLKTSRLIPQSRLQCRHKPT